ncbi:MAG: hypothetical protein ABJE00_07265 [Erythrobacter sp.]
MTRLIRRTPARQIKPLKLRLYGRIAQIVVVARGGTERPEAHALTRRRLGGVEEVPAAVVDSRVRRSRKTAQKLAREVLDSKRYSKMVDASTHYHAT